MTIGPSDVPLYQQLADIIREQILSGQVGPAQRLPSKRELRLRYDVGANTVERAYEVLRGEGLVRSVRGLGNFPTYPEDRPPRP